MTRPFNLGSFPQLEYLEFLVHMMDCRAQGTLNPQDLQTWWFISQVLTHIDHSIPLHLKISFYIQYPDLLGDIFAMTAGDPEGFDLILRGFPALKRVDIFLDDVDLVYWTIPVIQDEEEVQVVIHPGPPDEILNRAFDLFRSSLPTLDTKGLLHCSDSYH